MRLTSPLSHLLSVIDGKNRVVIQTHRHPDFDALASAFGLWALLKESFEGVQMVYTGEVLNHSMMITIREMNIPIQSKEQFDLRVGDQIIYVDCYPGNSNVDELGGQTLAVIDHHPNKSHQSGLRHEDVRDHFGSCSSMVAGYYLSSKWNPNRDVATVLMMGIMMDTSYLSRGVCDQDLEAFHELFALGDWKRGNFLLKNSLSVSDLPRFREALKTFRFAGSFGFAYLDMDCPGETLALIADDFLRFHEIHTVVIAGNKDHGIKFSVRSEDPELDAGAFIQKALSGWGTGGGHAHMGGGLIPGESIPELESLYRRMITEFNIIKVGIQ